MEEKKLTPQQRYKKKHVKRYYLELLDTTDKDLIEKLESVDKYTTYLKKLIKEDIEKTKKE
ncbi:MAG: hypothetical protein KH328_01295 [Staphylococcus sp.]|nr:hypothetical protein [Staphylococcus sp.]